MTGKKNIIISLTALLMCLSGCSGNIEPQGNKQPVIEPPVTEPPVVVPPTDGNEEKIPIRISTSTTTKVTEQGYDKGDRVGIYMVNYSGSSPDKLKQEGNYLDNVGFTFDGTQWNPEKEVFWMDKSTTADFYCYYPHNSEIADIHNIPLAVKADQSKQSAYKGSEFMYGKTNGANPSQDAVNIMTTHIMSKLVIILEPGIGYTTESLENEDIAITITGLKTEGSVDLSYGRTRANGSTKDMIPYKAGKHWEALVIPQSIEDVKLLEVRIGKNTYTMQQTITFKSNWQHKCKLSVDKLNDGVNIGINGWETDDKDYGGILQ